MLNSCMSSPSPPRTSQAGAVFASLLWKEGTEAQIEQKRGRSRTQACIFLTPMSVLLATGLAFSEHQQTLWTSLPLLSEAQSWMSSQWRSSVVGHSQVELCWSQLIFPRSSGGRADFLSWLPPEFERAHSQVNMSAGMQVCASEMF